jgi:hypothetical protein
VLVLRPCFATGVGFAEGALTLWRPACTACRAGARNQKRLLTGTWGCVSGPRTSVLGGYRGHSGYCGYRTTTVTRNEWGDAAKGCATGTCGCSAGSRHAGSAGCWQVGNRSNRYAPSISGNRGNRVRWFGTMCRRAATAKMRERWR